MDNGITAVRVPHHHGRAAHRRARASPWTCCWPCWCSRSSPPGCAPRSATPTWTTCGSCTTDDHDPVDRPGRRCRCWRPAGYAVLGWRRATAWLAPAAAAAGLLAAACALAVLAVEGPRTGLGGLLRADALSAFMLIVIGAVALRGDAGEPRLPGRRARRRAAPPAPTAPVRRPHPGLHRRDGAGRARLQPRRAVGGGRGHHDPHRVPRRATAAPATPPRPPGSTW